MDLSALDTNAVPLGVSLTLVVIVALVTILLYGFSMKWSLSMAGCGEHGFGWSFLVSVVSGMCSSIAMAVVTMAAGGTSFLVSLACGILVAAVVVAMMTQSSPLSGFAAYLVFMVLCTVGSVGAFLVAVFALFLVGPSNLPGFDPVALKSQIRNVSFDTEASETDVMQLPNVPIQGTSPQRIPPANIPDTDMPTRFDDAFFEPEAAAPSTNKSSELNQFDPSRGLQTNPFVK